MGTADGEDSAGQPLPAQSRLHKTAEQGPQVADEYLYKVVDALDEVAKETGKTVPQIALNWLLQRPTVSTVIIGARNEEQLRQNLAAVGWNLSAEQVARLDAASDVTPVYPYWHQRQFTERNPTPVAHPQSTSKYLLCEVLDQRCGGCVACIECFAAGLVGHDQHGKIFGGRHPHDREILRVAAGVIEGASAGPWSGPRRAIHNRSLRRTVECAGA